MKFARIALALILTALLLYIARTNSRGRPEHFLRSENGYTFEMTTIPKAYERDTARIAVAIHGPLDNTVHPVFRHAKFGQDETTPLHKYDTTPMELADSVAGRYQYLATAGLKGGRLRYYVQVRDNTGGLRAEFVPEPNTPFVLKFIGHVPSWIVGIHIFFMFATVFLVVVGSLKGLDVVRGKGEVRPMARLYLWAAVCAFLGGYPFGFAMNWYTFGTIWEGVPFGTDATDNKTQLLFAYLLLVALSALGSLRGKRPGRDTFAPRTLGLMGVFGFVVMLGIYLIPHSIQFSPSATRIVCWSLIGLAAAVFAFGWIRALLPARTKPPRVEAAK